MFRRRSLALLPESRATVVARFVRSAAGSGVAVGARTVGALLLNKLLAVYGGAGGLTLLAHFQNLLALFTTLPGEGTHVGLIKYLAPLRAGAGRYRAFLGAGLLLNLIMWLGACCCLLVWPTPLLGAFRPTTAWVAGLLLGTALVIAQATLLTVLLAAGRLRAYVLLVAGQSLVGVAAVALVLAGGASVTAALGGYLLGQGALALPAAWVGYRQGLLSNLGRRLSPLALRRLSRFLLMAVSVLLFSKVVDFVLRDVLMRRFALAEVDRWQAVTKLSDNYTMVFSALMSSVYYPRVAALAGQVEALRGYVRTVGLLLAPTLAVGLGALYLARPWLLPLLFDARMVAPPALLAPQLVGDWAKFLTWLLLFVLMAQARVGRYVAVQAGAAVLYATLLGWLVPRYGLPGVPLAHAGCSGVLLTVCGLYFYRTVKAPAR